ncbi:hypothetical protein [Helicobacter sp. MIT 99-5507]|uniref:hypothetical protein n=1 Tax=Helicobacter sp. MIT 99-5507 TaxID=152489 RepID=UPI000E1F4178|nr:hypothetical protein [Helicobacter sp. MIT 99-5507]RDU57832.1 hypothetical protein CQA42_02710 [Helicobacter sp. MIT 99-5507]
MNSKAWLNELKIASVNKNDKKVLDLIENLPNFDNIDDLICAREIVQSFIQKLQDDRDELYQGMLKLKQARLFLEG